MDSGQGIGGFWALGLCLGKTQALGRGRLATLPLRFLTVERRGMDELTSRGPGHWCGLGSFLERSEALVLWGVV